MNRSIPFAAFFLAGAVVAAAAPRAQQAEPEAGLVAIHQALRDAATDVVVLNVAAHPDDESSRTDTILRRKHGMRVVTAYSTYGDGGQNAIGREIGAELAAIRVRETLRAAAMSGVEVRWLGMADFGFSKTLDETLAVWGKEALLAAMRAQIDAVDPDVIVTNHSLTQGHGHHRATWWAAVEVLKERAAAGRFVPWMFMRCGADDAQLVLDPAELDVARGETYARLAHRAWTQHVSQGPWGPHDPLQVGKDTWKLAFPADADAATVARATDLAQWGRPAFAGDRLPSAAATLPAAELQAVTKAHLLAVRAELAAAVRNLTAPDGRRRAVVLRRRADAAQRLLLALHGVRVEAWHPDRTIPFGGVGRAYVVVHGHERVTDLAVRCGDAVGEPAQVQARATPFDAMAANSAAPPPPSEPSVAPGADGGRVAAARPGCFQVDVDCGHGADVASAEDVDLAAAQLLPCTELVEATFTLDGVPFCVLVPLDHDAVPPVALAWDREATVVRKGEVVERTLTARAVNHSAYVVHDPIALSMGPGITATSLPGRLTLGKEHGDARILVKARIEADELVGAATLRLGFGDQRVPLPVRVVDVRVPAGMKVLLVRGPEDSTEQALADLGVPFAAPSRDELLGARLEDYTAVLLDIRAYFHRPELAELRDRLQQYCRAGGRVVAMYHKSGEWNEKDGRPTLAPFPLTVGEERVTDENAAVTLLQPGHPLLTYPHALGERDFAGWVQERGLNFPKTWDAAWAPLLAMQDPGDKQPHQGALLYTQFGRGDFVYCSLALYRQLRRGHEGALRLLVNLLARG